jgi:hypothetical protein
MKIRLVWHHNATLSISLASQSRLGSGSQWRHDPMVRAHTVILKIGRIRVVRFRPTVDHGRRLGLPVI